MPTSDSNASPSSAGSYTPVGERVLIVVTSDSERFVTVDVSGAPNPTVIREQIFSKVRQLFIPACHCHLLTHDLVEYFHGGGAGSVLHLPDRDWGLCYGKSTVR